MPSHPAVAPGRLHPLPKVFSKVQATFFLNAEDSPPNDDHESAFLEPKLSPGPMRTPGAITRPHAHPWALSRTLS